jgi:hypothetical protein
MRQASPGGDLVCVMRGGRGKPRPYNGSRGARDKSGHGVPRPYKLGGEKQYG